MRWNHLGELLDQRAESTPGRGIYVRGARGVQEFRTLAQLRSGSARVARGISDRGVKAGERVLVEAATSFQFLEAFFGLVRIGAIPIAVRGYAEGGEWEQMERWRQLARRYEADHLVVDEAMEGMAWRWAMHPLRSVETVETLTQGLPSRVDVAVKERDEEGMAFIQLTSGTSSKPKGVKLSHRGIRTSVEAIGRRIEVDEDDVIVSWLPLDNIMGLVGVVIFALHWEIRPVLMEPEGFLEAPEDWFWTIEEHDATLSLAPNFAFNYCVRRCNEKQLEGLDLSSWRIAMNGAEPVRAQHIQSFFRRFHRYGLGDRVMMPVYGLSEATLGVSFHEAGRPIEIDGINRRKLEEEGVAEALPEEGAKSRRERMHVVSVGRPLEELEVEIRGASGEVLGDRRLGEIAIRGTQVMQGYVGDEEEEVNEGETRLGEGGWLLTGDLGYLVEGQLYFVSRASDLIELKSGRKVIPEEVELFVDAIDGVRAGSSACFAIGDAVRSGDVVVVFEGQSGAHRGRLERRVAAVLEAHLGLSELRIEALPVRSVPKTATGKIQRHRCQTWWEEGMLGEEETLGATRQGWERRASLVGETVKAGGATVWHRLMGSGQH